MALRPQFNAWRQTFRGGRLRAAGMPVPIRRWRTRPTRPSGPSRFMPAASLALDAVAGFAAGRLHESEFW